MREGPGRKDPLYEGRGWIGYPMPEEILQETRITLSPLVLPLAGALLMAAGLCLLIWSDIIVDLVVAFLGILAILLGLGLLAAGHILGRAGVPPVFLFIGGVASILVGILALLREDLVIDLILYLTAGIAVLLGAFLLFIGAILSLPGWGRRGFLLLGAALLIGGIALALFPGPVGGFLLAAGGVLLLLAGGAVLLLSVAWRRPARHRV